MSDEMEFQNWIGKIFFMAMMSDQARLAYLHFALQASNKLKASRRIVKRPYGFIRNKMREITVM